MFRYHGVIRLRHTLRKRLEGASFSWFHFPPIKTVLSNLRGFGGPADAQIIHCSVSVFKILRIE